MAQPIKIRRTTTSNAPTGLKFGELAFVEGNKKLYAGDSAETGVHLISDITLSGKATLIVTIGNQTDEVTTGTGKAKFRMPFAMTAATVRASAGSAPTGAALVIDINEAGASILSTKLSMDATETTTTTAATPAVISDGALADDAEITIDFDSVGATYGGAGIKVTIIGQAT